MIVRAAKSGELGRVMEFYYDLIDSMRDLEFKPKWEKGVYPTERFIQDSIKRNELFVADDDGRFIGAMAINHDYADGYDGVAWAIDAQKNEIAVIHVLGTNPLYQRRGIAKQMTAFAIETCGKMGMKVIRLDVLAANLPAQRLYSAMGFAHRDTIKLFYEDTGLTDFLMYELVL